MRIKIYPPLAIHELGNRDNQEDYIYPEHGHATTGDSLFIVCDGMGGHENGEVASQTFAVALAEFFKAHASSDTILQDKLIADAIAHAYKKLDAADNGNYKKMGTTLTLLFFHRGGVTAVHIGDSRIYHLRPGKRLLYVSRDHSLVFDLYQSGEITYGEMKTSMQKNVITRAVQPGEDNRVKPDIIHITDIKPGDYFFMCSDGMLEKMDDDDILQFFSAKGDDEKKLKRLIAATAQNQDNHSAYIIHVENVTMDADDDLITINEEATARCNALNMKPLNASAANDDDDDDLTVTASSTTPSSMEKTEDRPPRRKRKSTWRWAILIAAIVAAAAGLALYGWNGRHNSQEQEQPRPAVETNSVHSEEPLKPELHHSAKPQRVRDNSRDREAAATAASASMKNGDTTNVKESKKRRQAANGDAAAQATAPEQVPGD